jgi:hypothetical protein
MSRPMLSAAGAALLRMLLDRAADDRQRFLLSSWTSVDWQSMTFNGERHRAAFRLTGPDAMQVARRWTDGLEDAEFDLGPTRFLAEIAVSDGPVDHGADGVTLALEALTLAD